MFCKKCGAVVNGKFCSCCGQRIRSDVEEYRLVESRTKREFVNACAKKDGICAFELDLMHLADACWLASNIRYDTIKTTLNRGYDLDVAFSNLKRIREHAEKLFNSLVNF